MKPPIRLLVVALLATPAVAQTPVTLLRAPDPNLAPNFSTSTLVPGVGFIIKFNALAINDSGEWLADVTTNAQPVEIADVILRNGFLTLQQGTILGKPQNARITNFRNLNVDNAGNSMWDFEFVVPPGTATQGGLFFNTKLIAQTGDLLNTVGYSRDAKWLSFNGVVSANQKNQLVVSCQVSDQNIAGTNDDAFLLLTVDNQGNVLSSFDIGHEAGQLPTLGNIIPQGGLPSGINDRGQFALNNNGDVIWNARINGAPDRVIMLNDKVLVKQGEPSPIPGFTWNSIGNSRVGLNDQGDWVMLGNLSGLQNSRLLLTLNNQVFLRQRTTFPAITPNLIDDFGDKMPISVMNTGDPLFRMSWTGSSFDNLGLMVGKEIVVRKNHHKLNDLFIENFPDFVTSLTHSPGGRYVIFVATLEDGSNAVGMVDLGRVTKLQGCVPNQASLTRQKGFAVAGKTITLAMDKGQGIGVTPFLMVSDRAVPGYPPCGITTGYGELLIDFGANGNPFLLKIGNPYVGSPVPITLPIANSTQLIDKHVYAQGMFVNIGGQAGAAQKLLLTNAVEIQIGAP